MQRFLHLLLLSLGACGWPMVENRIVGGQDSKKGEWPWQVSLQYDGSPTCGGTLITDSLVLLVAHCFDDSLVISRYTVYIGTNELSGVNNTNAVIRGVRQIIIHPNYTEEGSSGDIALLELNKSVTFTSSVLPVFLPPQDLHLPEGTLCWITGWGGIKDRVKLPPPMTLQQAEVALIDNATCEAMYRASLGYAPNIHLIKKDMICAGYKTGQKDACQGDSGGPLVCNVNRVWFQIGIIGWGFGCAQPNRPGVYTSVQYYQSWLQQYVSPIWYTEEKATQLLSSVYSISQRQGGQLMPLVANGTLLHSWSVVTIFLLFLSLLKFM